MRQVYEATTSIKLTKIENAFVNVLGVRYVQPYFNDLEDL